MIIPVLRDAPSTTPALSDLVYRFSEADPSGAQACLNANFRRGMDVRAGSGVRADAMYCDRALARFMLQNGVAVSPGLLRDALRNYAPVTATEAPPGWSTDLVSAEAAKTAQDYGYNWGGSTDMPPILATAPGPQEPFSALARTGFGAGGGGGMMAPMSGYGWYGVGQAPETALVPLAPSPWRWVYLAGAALAIGWAMKELAGGRRLRII